MSTPSSRYFIPLWMHALVVVALSVAFGVCCWLAARRGHVQGYLKGYAAGRADALAELEKDRSRVRVLRKGPRS